MQDSKNGWRTNYVIALIVIWAAMNLLTTRSSADLSFNEPVKIWDKEEYGGGHSPEIATDQNGNWIIAWSSSGVSGDGYGDDDELYYTRSGDGGNNWSTPAVLNTNAATDYSSIHYGHDHNVSIATNETGVWVAVWMSNHRFLGTGWDHDIVYARSFDNGQTWSDPKVLNDTATEDNTKFWEDWNPQIHTDGLGNWVVAWHTYPALSSRGSKDITDHRIRASYSGDDGASWTSLGILDSNLETDDQDNFIEDITSDYSGNWLITWRGGTGDQNAKMFCRRSSDGGRTWTSAQPMHTETGPLSGDFKRNLNVMADGAGNWLCTFQSRDIEGVYGNDNDIFVSISQNAGLTWSERIPVNPWADSDDPDNLYYGDERPMIATDHSGNWVIVWVTKKDEGYNEVGHYVYASQSANNGLTWSDPIIVSVVNMAVFHDDCSLALDRSGNCIAAICDEGNIFFSKGFVSSSGPQIEVRQNGKPLLSGLSSVDYGTVALGGNAATRSFEVSNKGNEDLQLSDLVAPAGFSIAEGLAAIIAPGESDTFSVRLPSDTEGTFSGDITFSTNCPDLESFVIDISGTVIHLTGVNFVSSQSLAIDAAGSCVIGTWDFSSEGWSKNESIVDDTDLVFDVEDGAWYVSLIYDETAAAWTEAIYLVRNDWQSSTAPDDYYISRPSNESQKPEKDNADVSRFSSVQHFSANAYSMGRLGIWDYGNGVWADQVEGENQTITGQVEMVPGFWYAIFLYNLDTGEWSSGIYTSKDRWY